MAGRKPIMGTDVEFETVAGHVTRVEDASYEQRWNEYAGTDHHWQVRGNAAGRVDRADLYVHHYVERSETVGRNKVTVTTGKDRRESSYWLGTDRTFVVGDESPSSGPDTRRSCSLTGPATSRCSRTGTSMRSRSRRARSTRSAASCRSEAERSAGSWRRVRPDCCWGCPCTLPPSVFSTGNHPVHVARSSAAMAKPMRRLSEPSPCRWLWKRSSSWNSSVAA